MVTDAICREARTVFGADVAMLWRVNGETLTLSAFDPELDPLHEGLSPTSTTSRGSATRCTR